MAAGPQAQLTIAVVAPTPLSTSYGPTEILADAKAALVGAWFTVVTTGTGISLIGPAMGVTDTPTPGL